MGSVTILSSLGGGHYTVRINFDNTRVDQRVAAIQSELDGYAAKLSELQTKKIPLDATLKAAKTALNDYTSVATVYDLVNNSSIMNGLVEKVFKAQVDVEMKAREISLLKLKKTALTKEKAYLEKNCPSTLDTTAWCVEYEENLSGTIDSIEVDYLLERDNITGQIRHDTGVWLPGTARAPAARLQHVLATSSFATWFNLCMAPAMQRHKPMYRIATLSNLDKSANTCDLDFIGRYDIDKHQQKIIGDKPILPNFSQGGGLPAVQQIHYTGATIEYGTCNAKAFVNGDKVIVDLHKGVGVPTVIGFYENPRQCINWNTTAWGFYDTNAQPSGLGIPPDFNGLGPISRAAYTKGATSLSGGETDLTYSRTSTTTLQGGVVLQYVWTFRRTATVYEETNVLHTNVLHEEINIDLLINGALYGSVYSYLRDLSLSATYTPRVGAPWIKDPHQSITRSASVTAKQLQVDSKGIVKAVRSYAADEDYLNNSVTYSRTTAGAVTEALITGTLDSYLFGFLATLNDPTYAGQVSAVVDYNVNLYLPAWRLR